MNQERPPVNEEELNKPVSKGGGDLPPLEQLPTREWLSATIKEVEYRTTMFNGQVQYMTKKEFDEAEGKEVEVAILDDNGEKIPRREFSFTFDFKDYQLPNGNPRNCWLQLGASLGDKAHLPTFLYNTLGHDADVETPQKIIDSLTGLPVRLQLKDKLRKDKTLPPYQQVVYDAVEAAGNKPPSEPVEPIKETDVTDDCKCNEENRKESKEGNSCLTCGKIIVRWDE